MDLDQAPGLEGSTVDRTESNDEHGSKPSVQVLWLSCNGCVHTQPVKSKTTSRPPMSWLRNERVSTPRPASLGYGPCPGTFEDRLWTSASRSAFPRIIQVSCGRR